MPCHAMLRCARRADVQQLVARLEAEAEGEGEGDAAALLPAELLAQLREHVVHRIA